MAALQPRLDEAQTPPSPMDVIRSLLTDCEDALQQHSGHAFDLAVDAAVDALLELQEQHKRSAGTWTVNPDMQSGYVLAAEIPGILLAHADKPRVLRIKHEDPADNG